MAFIGKSKRHVLAATRTRVCCSIAFIGDLVSFNTTMHECGCLRLSELYIPSNFLSTYGLPCVQQASIGLLSDIEALSAALTLYRLTPLLILPGAPRLQDIDALATLIRLLQAFSRLGKPRTLPRTYLLEIRTRTEEQ